MTQSQFSDNLGVQGLAWHHWMVWGGEKEVVRARREVKAEEVEQSLGSLGVGWGRGKGRLLAQLL